MRGYQCLLLSIVFVGTSIGAASAGEQQRDDQHADMKTRGEHVMGFSQDKTTHHFELNQDGGVIEVRTNDINDTQTLDQIRGHFRHIVTMFAAGNFSAPMLVHGRDVPGTVVMSQLQGQLHWQLQEVARGAKIIVSADSKAALDAVHEFLRFQIITRREIAPRSVERPLTEFWTCLSFEMTTAEALEAKHRFEAHGVSRGPAMQLLRFPAA